MLELYGQKLSSRLLLGTALYPSPAVMAEAVKASGTEIAGAAGRFAPVVGREPLQPESDTEVLAKFADGTAAMTRHAHGKGQVWVAGFFPGLEYSAAVRSDPQSGAGRKAAVRSRTRAGVRSRRGPARRVRHRLDQA